MRSRGWKMINRMTLLCLLWAPPFLLWAPVCLLWAPPAQAANEADRQDAADQPFAHLPWRNVGPVNMSGRVADVEGVVGDPRTVYVGAGSGGVWKSTDGGVTFAPIFDQQPVASIGDIAVAPSNPQVLYVGTGEGNVRNSVSFGNGVYRSADGGETWSHVGLEGTQQIARIVVDPTDADRVFVAAIGPIYGPRNTRGVYRTLDGGGSWQKVLYLDEDHGAADLDIDPTNPNVLFATLWRFRRQPWDFESGSKEGGVWRSRDGGTTWRRLQNGLPEEMGRVAVKIAPSNPQVIYVLAESNDGILFRSDDRGESFRKVSDNVQLVSRGFYYTDLRVDPTNENKVYAVASRLFRSIDGGKSFERIARPVHIDFHSLWIDPEDADRMWVGEDGGVARTIDGGGSWRVPRTLPIGQFYQVFVGAEAPFYTVGGGLQDNGTWFGPSRTREPAGITVHDWKMMSFGDAYFVVQHPSKHYLYLSESQAGNLVRTDVRTYQQQVVSPQAARNDGGPVGELTYRFNWNAPIIASPHDGETIYFCGNVVFRSRDFGSTWEVISPDLTTNDTAKQGNAGGPVWPENTTAEYHTTIISFAESPLERGVLWVGTDDGNLQLSRDDGATWSALEVPGVPAFSPVSHIEASGALAGRAYVSFDRHMFDDFRPHAFRTEDYGATWTSVVTGLPDPGWIWVLREDPRNTDLLYAGTEVGLWASWDRGDSWRKLHLENLPTVAVHDVLIHPRDNDLVLGTHGRGIWIFDDATPIQRHAEVADKAIHLFPVRDAVLHQTSFSRYGLGDDVWKASNPPYGALLTYHLSAELATQGGEQASGDPRDAPGMTEAGAARDAEGEGMAEKDPPGEPSLQDHPLEDHPLEDHPLEDHPLEDHPLEDHPLEDHLLGLEILDADGRVIRTLDEVPAKAGLQRVAWDLRVDPPTQRDDEPDPAADFFGPGGGPLVPAGKYTARLSVGGQVAEAAFEVVLDPLLEVTAEAMAAKFETATAIAAMVDAANRSLRALDRIAEQLSARRATERSMRDEDHRTDPHPVDEVFDSLAEDLKAQQGIWQRDDDKPFWSQGPKLAGRVGRFLREIDGAFAAPTAAQKDFVEALRGDLAQALTSLAAFLERIVPEANRKLVEHRVPAIAIPVY